MFEVKVLKGKCTDLIVNEDTECGKDLLKDHGNNKNYILQSAVKCVFLVRIKH